MYCHYLSINQHQRHFYLVVLCKYIFDLEKISWKGCCDKLAVTLQCLRLVVTHTRNPHEFTERVVWQFLLILSLPFELDPFKKIFHVPSSYAALHEINKVHKVSKRSAYVGYMSVLVYVSYFKKVYVVWKEDSQI